MKSVPPPDRGPLPDSAHQPAIKDEIPWGSLNRHRQQPQKPNRRPEPLTQEGRLPRGFHSPQGTRIWRARTSADTERPLNKWLTPAARTLQETEIKPLYKILLHNRKVRPLARPQPVHLTRHPKYCAYHQLAGHPTSKCRSLRERLEGFVRQGVVAIAPRGESTNANATSRRRRSPRSPMKALSLLDSGQAGPTWSLLAQSTTLHTPVSSTLLADKAIENAQGILFEVPANRLDQKPILFRRYQRGDFPHPRERDEQGEPDYSWVSPKVVVIMERWGYRFEDKEGLNYGKGRRTPLEVCSARGIKDYRGLGYSTTLDQSDVDSNPLSRYDHSSDTSSFNSDINMVSAQPEPDDDEIELINTEDDPWMRHLNMLWDIRFEQREPPTDDALLQVNMGDEANGSPYTSVIPSLKVRRQI